MFNNDSGQEVWLVSRALVVIVVLLLFRSSKLDVLTVHYAQTYVPTHSTVLCISFHLNTIKYVFPFCPIFFQAKESYVLKQEKNP